jgi:hypothetical protein
MSVSVKAFKAKFFRYFPKFVGILEILLQHLNRVAPKDGVEKVELYEDIDIDCPNHKEPSEGCSEWTFCQECCSRSENGGCPTHVNHQRKIYKKLSSGSLDYSNFDEVLNNLNDIFDPDFDEDFYIEAFLIGLARSIGMEPPSIGIEERFR